MTDFELQFALDEVCGLAARYSYDEDDHVLAIGLVAGTRGWYTRPEFVSVCRWKSPRTQPLVETNSRAAVEEATQVALGAVTEEVRVGVLLSALRGVSWPTASVLLHLAHQDRYPILDYRALEALGIDNRPNYSMEFWLSYVKATRDLADAANVDMRTLDRALWQWSKEREMVRSSQSPGLRPTSTSQPRIEAPGAGQPDAIVLGCVSSKRRGPTKARDLYTSPLFEKRRRYAEGTGLPWVIFSAKYGILDPEDVIEWYDVALARLPAQSRRDKGLSAAAQLEERFGPLHGKVFEIHAGAAYVDAIGTPLLARGARVTNPLEGLGIGYQLQWYGTRRPELADT